MEHKPSDVELREALVLGLGPRIGPIQVDTLTEDLSKIIVRMIQLNSSLESRERGVLADLMSDHAAGASAMDISGQLANLPEIVGTMLRHRICSRVKWTSASIF